MNPVARRLADQASSNKTAKQTKAAHAAKPLPALRLPGLDGPSAAELLAAANDLTLVLSPQGRILQAWASDAVLAQDLCAHWVGREWADVVGVEGSEKIAALLLEATTQGKSQRWRQVNHALPKKAAQSQAGDHSEDTLPVQYSTVAVRALPAGLPGLSAQPQALGYVLACGRDMRPAVQMQRRLVDAQQAMERDYWRFREAETRYRTLFQSSPDAVLIVEGPTYRVLEANPAAEALLTTSRRGVVSRASKPAKLVGTPLLTVLGSGAAEQVLGLMAQVLSQGNLQGSLQVQGQVQGQGQGQEGTAPVTVTLAGDGPSAGLKVQVAVVLYRQEQLQYWLVRLVHQAPETRKNKGSQSARPDQAATAAHALEAPATTAEALSRAYAQQVSDAVVFTDGQGRILSANAAFAALAQISGTTSCQGQPLGRWLGETGVELGVLLNQLRTGGQVGSFTTQVRGEFGAVAGVELSAVALHSVAGQPSALAFTLRDHGRRAAAAPATSSNPPDKQGANKLARSPSELNELVGRVPMKDIVSETSDMIEKLCIEAALQMARDNRALAAQLLGLSRQSLYVKLRRYGLGELGEEGDESSSVSR